MTPPTTPERFDELKQTMQKGFERMEKMLIGIEERVRNLEQSEARNQGVQGVRLDNAEKTLEDHDKRIEELEKLAPAIKVGIWIMSVLGVSVIALIWSILTHAVTIVKP